MKELIFKEEEKLEARIFKIINFLYDTYHELKILLTAIDATGKTGNRFTKLLNEKKTAEISFDEMKKILKEDGQIVDGKIEIYSKSLRLISIQISDGVYIDVEEYNISIPGDIIGEYTIIDNDR